MSADLSVTRRRGTLFGLFGGTALAGDAAEAGPAVTMASPHHALWSEIGDFLATHGLAPTPTHYAVIHAYLSGDPAVRRPIERALQAGAAVDSRLLAEIEGATAKDVRPEFLTDMATKLEARLADCFRLVGLSSTSAADYGAALDQGVADAAVNPQATFERLARLTKAVGVATRAIESQLDDTRRETERLRADLQAAKRAAERDHLTGLPNRRFFDARLNAAAADPGSAAVLALCDIDNFKLVNDQHGHDTGDRVLRFFASAVRGHLKGKAVVARYGGEEFACLFDGASLVEARDAIEAMRDAVAARVLRSRTSGAAIGAVRFSAGLTTVRGDGEGAMARADRALYAAKHNGKNRTEIECAPVSPAVSRAAA